jgi:cell filamentation protein
MRAISYLKETPDCPSLRPGKRHEYFVAVQAGLDKNYAPMERLFTEILERSLASS